MANTKASAPPAYDNAASYPLGHGEPPPVAYPQGHGQAPPPGMPLSQQPQYGTGYGQQQYGMGTGYTQPAPKTWDPNVENPEATTFVPDTKQFNTESFSDKVIRHAFIRKVYLILMAQLLVTVGFVCIFLFVEPVKYWVQRNSWFYYVSYGLFIVTYISLICVKSVRRNFPGNMICLAVFTFAFSYMTGTISSFYSIYSVLIAAGVTSGVCLGLTVFAMQTKIDFTMCSGIICALCLALFFFGLSVMIVYLTIGYSYILQAVYGGLASLLFSMFLVYDTQMLVGGRKHELSAEEYVYASLQLYLDVVYLFLIILACFGSSN